MIYLILLFGAIWRVVDGSEIKPKGWNLLPIILIPVIAHFYGWGTTGAYVVGYIALLDGFHGWHKFGYMRMHFTGYAALAVALFSGSLVWIALAFLAGMMYPTLHKLYERGFRLPHYGIVNNYTTYCEFISGAVMLGGALL